MVQPFDDELAVDVLRARIREAFPDEPYLGAVTLADDHLDAVVDGELLYDEEQDPHKHLYGRRWSEIPAAVIERNETGHNLLTEEAFCVFLPAWLICSLVSNDVREMMAYALSSPGSHSQEWQDSRFRKLTVPQIKVLQSFVAYCLEVEPAEFVKDHLRAAATRMARLSTS